jgi:hypothetical protein
MSTAKNKHSVVAGCVDGDLSTVTWRHRGEAGKLVRVQEGWVLVLSKTCYQLTMPGTPSVGVFRDDSGEYMATTVKPNQHYSTTTNAVVIVDGAGTVVIDSEVLVSDDTSVTKEGVQYKEGDVITVGGRRARIAIGQEK